MDGLRARWVTAGSKPDHSALDITLEIENVSPEAVDLAFTGYIPLGFTTFRLDDAQGHDIEPDWRFGGNSPTGDSRALFRAGQTVRYSIHRGAFPMMANKRALRIGAFWGRELPSDGTKRFLRAVVHGSTRTDHTPDFAYEGNELVRNPPTARSFTGALEIPAVCVE